MTVTPSIIGISISPLPTADRCCTVCWYSGRNVSAPSIATPSRKLIPVATEKLRFLNTCNGSTGSAARVSMYRNAAVAATATMARAMICPDSQRYWLPPQVVSKTTEVAAIASIPAPR